MSGAFPSGLPTAIICDILQYMAKHHRPADQTPDLFAGPAPQTPRPAAKATAANSASTRRPLLPGDLPTALTYLEDAELDVLAKAVAGELHRRGRQASKDPSKSRPRPTSFAKDGPKTKAVRKTAKAEPPTLTQSKINAVRAAFKAGVKPTMIARQFGVSPAAIRQVLSDKNT